MEQMVERLKRRLEEAETNAQCDKELLYQWIVEECCKEMKQRKQTNGKRKLYYISAEFLIGKMLTSNLINLGVLDEVKHIVKQQGYTWKEIQDLEEEPSLGNGGLGRLAACFLDSIATLDLCGDGIGLYYHFGLFEQRFQDFKQKEYPNAWMTKTSWFHKAKSAYEVVFPKVTLRAVQYDMDVIGYHNGRNALHLFDVETVDESIVQEGIAFDKTDIAKNLTLFLYPDDSDDEGRLLRIYQQYFMVSCAAQMIIEECKEQGYDLHQLHEHIVIQINDTHPSLVICELIRLLMKEGLLLKEAVSIVEKTCAYTNHTILAEALETWPMEYLQQVVPQLLDIMMALDAIANQRCKDENVAIIDKERRVHMAHMDIHFGKNVNGVAALHTEILKNTELHSFYTLYPEKFQNKTNGITFTRWLASCNTQLYSYLCNLLHVDILEEVDALSLLMNYREDTQVLNELLNIKQQKKHEWVQHIKKKQGIIIDETAIFDTQVKRLHEYKRQQMHALYLIHKYMEIKNGHLPKRPIVAIFGAKAAPAYTIAKDIIHLLLCLQELVQKDRDVAPYLQICFIENYNVSEAELVIPASDISEQISLASKEASGTGNMKFMLNGAVTIGTSDGANVEIAQLVKEENIYLFGESSEQVIAHYANADYCSKQLYEEDEHIREIVDFIIGEELCAIGDEVCLTRLYKELLTKDWFMTLLDLNAYIACKEQMYHDFEDRMAWAGKMLCNIANSAYFSSTRTIEEYNKEIWKLRGGDL